MNIVYAGPLGPDDTCEMRRRALERLGHRTVGVDLHDVLRRYARLARRSQWRLRCGPMVQRYNDAIMAAAAGTADGAWIDKGLFVTSGTLTALRRRGVKWIVHYSPDNYLLAQNWSRHLRRALPLYDAVVTTKPAIVDALIASGARRVVVSQNAYDPDLHRPVSLSPHEQITFGADVVFVGRWESERERLLDCVAGLGVVLAIWGPDWAKARSPRVRAAYRGNDAIADGYAKAMAGARIALGLLSTVARDTITQRSIEIPACGAFMLAKRTAEHLEAFRERVEAEFFGDVDELVSKIRRYLDDEPARVRVAAAGRARCLTSGYSYPDRMQAILASLS